MEKIVSFFTCFFDFRCAIMLAMIPGLASLAVGQTTMTHFGLNGNLNPDIDNVQGTPTASQTGLTFSTNNVCEGTGHLYCTGNNDYIEILINGTGYFTISISWQQRDFNTNGAGRWNFIGDYNNDGTADFTSTSHATVTSSCALVSLLLPAAFNNQNNMRFRFTSSGAGTSYNFYIDDITIKGLPPGGIVTEIFTSTGSWTVPNCITSISVECWGAGGGGGYDANSSNNGGGGGGGGGYAKLNSYAVTPGYSYSITVGAAGAGGTSGSTTGGTGGDSYFVNASTCMAKGGTGGGPGNTGTAGTGGVAGSSVGDVKHSGGSGSSTGTVGRGGGGSAGTGSNGNSGSGSTGATVVTGGGPGGNGGTDADGSSPISGPGGGGGGGDAEVWLIFETPHNGGAGYAGQVRITYTLPNDPTISLGANPSVPQGTTIANLPYTATSGCPDQYSVNWDATAEGQGFADVSYTTLPATPIILAVPADAAVNTYNATLTVRNSTYGFVSSVYNITVTITSSLSITTGTIEGSPFCITATTGAAVSVPFTSVGILNGGNVYTAQLSNASGSFASPVAIGTLASTANSGTISATIPANTPTGTGYRIRVVSSSPVATGTANGSNLTISIKPTATLSGDAEICQGNQTNLSVALTGSQPWTIIIGYGTGDGLTYSGITSTPFTVAVSPNETTTYSLLAVSDAHCDGSYSGSATVTVYQVQQDGTLSGGTSPNCLGNSTGTLTLSGNSGAILKWQKRLGTEAWQDIAHTGSTYSEIPSATGTWEYRVVLSGGGAGCPNISSSVTIVVNPRPSANISGTTTICEGEEAKLNLYVTATGSWSMTLSPSVGTITGSGTGFFFHDVEPTANTTYTIASLTDASCSAQSGDLTGSAIITIDPSCPYVLIHRPAKLTAEISGTTTICPGGTATVTMRISGGNQPWAVSWINDPYDPHGPSDSQSNITGTEPYDFTFQVSPTQSWTYNASRVVVSDSKGCPRTTTGQAIITVAEEILFEVVPSDITCFGAHDGKITVYVYSGSGPFYYGINGEYTGQLGEYEYTFEDLGTGTYTITVKDVYGCIGTECE